MCATNGDTSDTAPATERQISYLRNLGVKNFPKGLQKRDASGWIDHLAGKAKDNLTITEDDLSGPPTFHEASSITSTPVPAPTSSPTPLPTSDEWITVEAESDAFGNVTRRVVRIAGHAFPGETYEQASGRLLSKAVMTATGKAASS
jgi:hypothetical protein